MEDSIQVIEDGCKCTSAGLKSLMGREIEVCVDDISLMPGCRKFASHILKSISLGEDLKDEFLFNYGYYLIKCVYINEKIISFMELLEDGRFCLGVSKAVRVLEEQISLCKKFDANLSPPSFEQLAVISDGLWEGDAVKGVRYPSPPHMSGWWLITDRYDGNTKSLKTVHIRHVTYQRPEITKYISLPFGFRFSSQDDEVWFDEKVALDR